jgi:hypothetical protein
MKITGEDGLVAFAIMENAFQRIPGPLLIAVHQNSRIKTGISSIESYRR